MKPEIVVFSLVIIALLASGYMAVTGGFVGLLGSGNQIDNGDVIMGNSIAVFDTSMGTFKVELFEDKMPVTTGNFIKLARDGFYDGVVFHRVIDGFMIQGGDPTGTGTGGPGYTIEDEFVEGLSNLKYTVAMANTGQPNSGGSQFFINLVDNTYLDWNQPPEASKHPVFGKVIDGMDVIDAIGKVEVGAGARPEEDVVINKLTIE
jgi:peptidylprolyl isomerase